MIDTDHIQRAIYIPNGVSDNQGLIGYVSDGSKGIESINLLSGDFLWQCNNAAKPLIVYKDILAAIRLVNNERNTIQITSLDINAKGAVIIASEPIILPGWPGLDDDDDTLTKDVYIDNGMLVLNWQATLRYKGGAPPSSSVLAEHTKDINLVFRIDLESGKVEKQSLNRGSESQQAEFWADQLNELSPIKVWPTGNNIGALVFRETNGRPGFYLKSWNRSNKQATEVKLVEGEAMVPYVTPDKSYLFFHHEKLLSSPDKHDYKWMVFSADTGQPIAELTYEEGAKKPCIIKSNVYYLIEKQSESKIRCTIKAREITTDKVLWERLLYQHPVSKSPPLRL